MIKFRYLIHKETGTVIKYEDWLKDYQEDKEMIFPNKKKSEKQLYQPSIAFDNFKPKEMLFSDDFDIIYDSEFTTEELELANVSVFECVRRKIIWDNTGNNLSKKIEDIIEKRYENKSRYGIEV